MQSSFDDIPRSAPIIIADYVPDVDSSRLRRARNFDKPEDDSTQTFFSNYTKNDYDCSLFSSSEGSGSLSSSQRRIDGIPRGIITPQSTPTTLPSGLMQSPDELPLYLQQRDAKICPRVQTYNICTWLKIHLDFDDDMIDIFTNLSPPPPDFIISVEPWQVNGHLIAVGRANDSLYFSCEDTEAMLGCAAATSEHMEKLNPRVFCCEAGVQYMHVDCVKLLLESLSRISYMRLIRDELRLLIQRFSKKG